MLPLSPLRFSTIGKPILRTFEIWKKFRFFNNSSRTRAKARARAMARATARARRTRAKDRARARDGRTDGRPDGAIYLAKCAAPEVWRSGAPDRTGVEAGRFPGEALPSPK